MQKIRNNFIKKFVDFWDDFQNLFGVNKTFMKAEIAVHKEVYFKLLKKKVVLE